MELHHSHTTICTVLQIYGWACTSHPVSKVKSFLRERDRDSDKERQQERRREGGGETVPGIERETEGGIERQREKEAAKTTDERTTQTSRQAWSFAAGVRWGGGQYETAL